MQSSIRGTSVPTVEDQAAGLGERAGHGIGHLGERLAVPVADQDGPTPGGPTRTDVAPAVADHDAEAQVERPIRRGRQEHPGFRLAAGAPVLVSVVADPDVVDLQLGPYPFVHGLDDLASLHAGGDVRLVRHDDDPVARAS
jgi:hypothetical protein